MARWWMAALLALTAVTASAAETPAALAARLLDRLQARDYVAVEAMFTPSMAQAVPAEKLQGAWESLPAQFGAYKQRGDAQVSESRGMQIALTRLQFERGAVDAQIAIDADGNVAGLWLQPVAEVIPLPAVPADAPYRETEVSVGAGEKALPASLAMPKGAGPFPAVVLIHGSGPQDRNETIGPNRPFLDIARDLASQGIAVLRYEKRTRVHPQAFAQGVYTVDDETTDDAVAALALLRTLDGVDPERVFVLGHSQGGMLAPRVAQRAPYVAGVILLAAPARSLLTILPEQNRRLLGAQADGEPGKAFLAKLDAQIAHVRNPATAAEDTDTPLGLPVGYWRSIEAVDPVGDAQRIKQPLLFLQGGRDLQVVDADWQRWQAAFKQDPRATFQLYPALNHLAIAGQGPASLAEYQQPGHVDATLVADVARWIKGN
jgi:dienelactone hydrolase